MKISRCFITKILLSLLCYSQIACTSPNSILMDIPERVLLFDMGDAGSRFYWIPGLVTAADGTLVAVADKRWEKINDLPANIDVVVRRSEDNGKTWSEAITIAGEESTVEYGDPAIVLDKQTGNLICIMASGNDLWQSNSDEYMRINVAKSMDNGKTWTDPVDITSQIYGTKCEDKQRKQ